ncbi:uncharacterized protein TNCT_360811 [Trichonephila clavata]|uniref:Uncharacterized protein n=1 Tax=Trichonephila clavata TaxID=2740835 RepID=A0A8X6LU30_TRICU|nr:uncharacterized protein TNCT_360811 [Trichonephila clavata]
MAEKEGNVLESKIYFKSVSIMDELKLFLVSRYMNISFEKSFDEDIKPVIRKPRFSSYCKSLCKESLITGFPVIASTSGLIRKTIKILVFVVSLCGFLYQTSEFLKLYRAYPTMVDIKVENPDVVPLPAITVCNKNRQVFILQST